MAQAAYKTKIRVGGTPTGFRLFDIEPLNGSLRMFKFYGLAEGTIIEPGSIVELIDDDTGNPYVGKYSVDYLAGLVIFEDDVESSRTIQMNGTMIPTVAIAGAHSYTLDLTGDVADSTSFDKTNVNGGFKTNKQTMNDVSISLERYDDFSGQFKDMLTNRERVLIEIQVGDGSETIRGMFVAESTNSSGDQTALEGESISLQLDGDINSAFSWRTN